MGDGDRKVFAFALMAILLLQITSIPILTPAYGVHQTEKVSWQIVVVSSEPVCTISHYQLAEKYQIITEEYFKLYEFDTNHYQPECYSVEKFDWKYQKPDDLDLLILINDRDLGREKLHPLGIGGFYSHTGGDISQNHTIIFCECSSFKYSDPAWILSHELSHFILNYLGFDLSKVEDQIHYIDSLYDYCMEENYNETCKSVVTYIDHYNLGYTAKVMKPYQSAIGVSPFNQPLEEFELNSKELGILKEITKWWHDGRITNTEYSNSLEILTGQSFNNISSGSYLDESETLILGEPPKEEKVNSEFKGANYNHQDILKSFPIIGDSIPGTSFSDEYPDWFKTRALLWSSGKISDEGFAKSIDSLKKSIIGIEENPSLSIEELIGEANFLVDNGEYEKALGFIDMALENSKDSELIQIDLFLQKGTLLYLLEQYSNALVFFDASLKIEPGNIEALEKKGHTLVQLGDMEKAKAYFKLAIFYSELNY
jgi:tetratricopeptide (TPR) repeat protein